MPALAHLSLQDMLQMDEAAFRKKFATTPVKRTGYTRFMRNVLIAAGNSGQQALRPAIANYLTYQEPLIRGAAVWAWSCLSPLLEIQDAYEKICHAEQDEAVLAEWGQALRAL